MTRCRSKELSLGQLLERTGGAFASHVNHVITPPVQGDAPVCESKELDKGRDGDAGGEGGRQNKVVLQKEVGY